MSIAGGVTPTVPLAVGVHTIMLTVTDNDGAASAPDTVTITVNPIVLDATPYKVKGIQHVDLTWAGANTNVDIFRDGQFLVTTPNNGAYTDNLGKKGGGDTYVYQACEAGTSTCSNTVVVTF